MTAYVKDMLEDFPVSIKKTAKTPASEKLMERGGGNNVERERKEAFHTTVAKGLFLCKRARPDIQPTIAVLNTRVKEPNESDWTKLIRMMEYLNGTRRRH